ncbi:hypothetical protein [[Clostridium] colinum]|uniref:hypothetical protein n=1 Tax=[Clostridium] colinum TaxID=36835 RepID=UPI00202406F2|nr:hypothetical protein [[Clostridium] colinum]
MDIHQIIDEIDNKLLDLLRDAYKFPYSYFPSNGNEVTTFFINISNAEELFKLDLINPISNVGINDPYKPLSFTLTPLGIKVINELS